MKFVCFLEADPDTEISADSVKETVERKNYLLVIVKIREKGVGNEIGNHDAEDQSNKTSQEIPQGDPFHPPLHQKGEASQKESTEDPPPPYERGRGKSCR